MARDAIADVVDAAQAQQARQEGGQMKEPLNLTFYEACTVDATTGMVKDDDKLFQEPEE